MKKHLCIMLAMVVIAFAGTITKTFNFSETQLSFDRYDDYIIPNLVGLDHINEVGSPYLPMAIYNVLVPATADVVSITIENSQSVEIPGTFDVMPTPEYQPISLSTGPIINANQDIYKLNIAYPGHLVNYAQTGDKSGYRISSFALYPLQYIPSEKKLVLYTSITVKIHYEQGRVAPTFLTAKQKEVFSKEVRSIIINPNDIITYSPAEHKLQNEVNYLLITTDAFASSFQPLVDWRTKQGLKGEILLVSTINSTYPGRDLPEKIRNAIIYYYQNRGLIFVLLGGDNTYVPKRGVYISYSGYTETSMPCDLYFSDLTGSWDGDRDNVFGEVPSDSIDFYPDVYVGRASVNNTTQATTFVNKVFTYEKNPPTDYLKRMLLPSVMLFSSYNYHGRVVNDTIANITQTGWTDRLIIDPTTTTPMRDSLNNGFGFCHVSAHGNEVGFYTQTSQLIYGTAAASSQTNSNKLFILNSIACHPGAFDYTSDCLAEVIMNNPNGGGVATILNSRYGWGMPPQFGPSEWIDVKFYDFLFRKDSFLIGVAHARSKALYTLNAISGTGAGCWRWCIYELNLFGDPAMPMWTDVPQNLSVDFPRVIPIGPFNLNISVTSNSNPVNHALVSVSKGTEIYAQGYTNTLGSVAISVTATTPGKFYITVTAHNNYPYQDSGIVQANGAYVSFLRASYVDSAWGNGDGIPNPGEVINMRAWVKNWGNALASNVIGKLRLSESTATIGDSVKSFGNISANDSAYTGTYGYVFTVAPSCTNNQRINFQLYCQDAVDSIWISNISVRVGTPVLAYRDKTVYDPAPGNNNQKLDPGETADLILILANQGYGNGYNVVGTLRSYDSRLTVSDSVGTFGTIYHDTTGSNPTDRFTLTASSSIPQGTAITCSLTLTADGNYTKTIGFILIIGEFRTIDPIPDGPRTPPRYWAYDNVDTLYLERPVYNWVEIKNIGTRLSFNQNDQVRNVPLPAGFGTLKFYGQNYNSISISVDGWIVCGYDTTRAYSNQPIPSTAARPAMICANWDDLYHANSGIGGVYWYYNAVNGTFIVEWDSLYYYNATSTRDKFQVIFYDSTYLTPTGDNIILVQYMTANLTNSATVGIQDETRTIGIQYLYNATYHPAAAGLVSGRAIKFTTAYPYTAIDENLIVNINYGANLYTNRPNPFRDHTFITYNIPYPSKVSLAIYDAAGRLVKTLINNIQDVGNYTLRWDGKNEVGNKVSQGIYFCRLATEKNCSIRKLTIIK